MESPIAEIDVQIFRAVDPHIAMKFARRIEHPQIVVEAISKRANPFLTPHAVCVAVESETKTPARNPS